MISDCPGCSSPILITAEDIDQITCPDCGHVFHPVRQAWLDPLHKPEDYVRTPEEIEADALWEFGGQARDYMDQAGRLADLQCKDATNEIEAWADKLLEQHGFIVNPNHHSGANGYHKKPYKPRKG